MLQTNTLKLVPRYLLSLIYLCWIYLRIMGPHFTGMSPTPLVQQMQSGNLMKKAKGNVR